MGCNRDHIDSNRTSAAVKNSLVEVRRPSSELVCCGLRRRSSQITFFQPPDQIVDGRRCLTVSQTLL